MAVDGRQHAAMRVILLLAILIHAGITAEPVRDRIDAATRRQVIEHFAASDCWSFKELRWSEAGRERLARLLFSPTEGIGLSQWRFNIGAGVVPGAIRDPWRAVECFADAEGRYDWNRQEVERWYLRVAKRLGVPSFVAFCNSPPVFLTRNGRPNCVGLDGSCNLKPGAESAFARFLGDVLERFANHPDAAERIVFDRVSPINEPEWDWKDHKQEGMRATVGDIIPIAKAVAAELDRRRLKTRLLLIEAGENRFLYRDRDYLAAFAADPVLFRALAGVVCYHSYWSDGGDKLVRSRADSARAAAKHPGLRLWQSEYCVMAGGRDLGMDAALRMARVIHHDLVIAGATSWSWWTAVSKETYQDGLIYTDWRKTGDAESIIPAKLLWTLGNWSRFIRPGMHRLTLAGEDAQDPAGLLRSAYAGDDGRVVLVYVNPAKAAQPVEVSGSLPAGRCSSHVTSDAAGDDLRRNDHAPRTTRFTLPPRSVTTVVWER